MIVGGGGGGFWATGLVAPCQPSGSGAPWRLALGGRWWKRLASPLPLYQNVPQRSLGPHMPDAQVHLLHSWSEITFDHVGVDLCVAVLAGASAPSSRLRDYEAFATKIIFWFILRSLGCSQWVGYSRFC